MIEISPYGTHTTNNYLSNWLLGVLKICKKILLMILFSLSGIFVKLGRFHEIFGQFLGR
jgi:hypothetical protein